MIVIYHKENSHCQVCHFCVVGYLRNTLLSESDVLKYGPLGSLSGKTVIALCSGHSTSFTVFLKFRLII